MYTYRPCHICGEQTIGLYMDPVIQKSGVPVCEGCYTVGNRDVLNAEYARINKPESPAKRIIASAIAKAAAKPELQEEQDQDERTHYTPV